MIGQVSPVEAGGLAKGTGVSMSIVRESLAGSFGIIARVMVPVFIGLFLLAVVVGLVVIARRVIHEVRLGRASFDPRPLADPFASDVLGEW